MNILFSRNSLAALFFGFAASANCFGQNSAPMRQFRPPAVPLVTSDPYLSIWSEANNLTDDVTRHWTHRPHELISIVRIDGTSYRIMGNNPLDMPAMKQVSLKVTLTRTLYTFENSKVKVGLTFMTPALPDQLSVLTRPVTYLTWTITSLDHQNHKVQIFESTSGELAVNEPTQNISWAKESFGNGSLSALKVGSSDQTLLTPAGDDTRIDWGYAYAVAKKSESQSSILPVDQLIGRFEQHGGVGYGFSDETSVPAGSSQIALGYTFDCGVVGKGSVTRTLMIGYDELDSVLYFGQKLPPYWHKNFASPDALFTTAISDYPKLVTDCEAFDNELTNDATKVGGAKYAQIIALSYRECLAANGIAEDGNGEPLMFTKEDTSNGDIATVDVIFPMDPIWVFLSPSLAKATLESNFAYAASSHWKFPNAPHDLGTYPQAFGRDDGGEGMPVEESGNMILLTDGIAHAEGNPEYASRWWPQLTQWANYLVQYGIDPEDQLCTDDFMGHLAHNANLSVKAILALGAYGDLCNMRGDFVSGKKYLEIARTDAAHWMKVADGGNHSLLAFDKPGTWSQKYNLVWDQILNLNIFPPKVRKNEIAFYQTQMQPLGLPLDSRTKLTKTDWSIWSATMADSKSTFETFINPIYDYLNTTTTRDPIADSYMTNDATSGGMHARPVVGGFFIKLLANKPLWKKWASRDSEKVGNWAPLPKPPVVTEIVPSSQHQSIGWRYSTSQPAEGWASESFDDSSWQSGNGGFGTEGTPNAVIGTNWSTDDIWIRRSVVLPDIDPNTVALYVYHDEDVEVYFNGVLALKEPGYMNGYQAYEITPEAKKLLVTGAKITIAVHCHQTTGGQGIDVGICKVEPAP